MLRLFGVFFLMLLHVALWSFPCLCGLLVHEMTITEGSLTLQNSWISLQKVQNVFRFQHVSTDSLPQNNLPKQPVLRTRNLNPGRLDGGLRAAGGFGMSGALLGPLATGSPAYKTLESSGWDARKLLWDIFEAFFLLELGFRSLLRHWTWIWSYLTRKRNMAQKWLWLWLWLSYVFISPRIMV